MNSEADQSSLTITNIPEINSGNLDTFFICWCCERYSLERAPCEAEGRYGSNSIKPFSSMTWGGVSKLSLTLEHSLTDFDPPDQNLSASRKPFGNGGA